MQYTCEIERNKPLDEVVNLFNTPENAFKWMKGLEKFELKQGEAGEVGAISEMEFKMGSRIVRMREKILENKLPESSKFEYANKGVYNTVDNRFTAIDSQKTRYQTVNYFKFERLSMKLVAWMMPKAFQKQSMVFLTDFKAFAESQVNTPANGE